MINSTKKQHYIWRHYLIPWTSNQQKNGQIHCLMDNKVFSTGLMGVGNQRYFYEIPDFTDTQIELAKKYNEILTNNYYLRKANAQWIELFQLSSNARKNCSLLGMSKQEVDDLYDYLSKNAGELYHSKIEESAIGKIDLLRAHDCSFLHCEDDRNDFYLYLANQYTRTKRMHDVILENISNDNDKPTGYSLSKEDEDSLLFLAMIFASTNLGFSLSSQFFCGKFLENNTNTSFITGDQPIVNIYNDYSNNLMPDKLAFYYSLTPNLAILFHNEGKPEQNGETLSLTAENVEKYNQMIVSASLHQLYGNSKDSLECYLL
jgi:hypothetical protein